MGWLSTAWKGTTHSIAAATKVVGAPLVAVEKKIASGATVAATEAQKVIMAPVHTVQSVAHISEAAAKEAISAGASAVKGVESLADHIVTDARVLEQGARDVVGGVGGVAKGVGGAASDLSKYLPWIIGIAAIGGLAYAANQAGLLKKGGKGGYRKLAQ